jgi:hypothetical protein
VPVSPLSCDDFLFISQFFGVILYAPKVAPPSMAMIAKISIVEYYYLLDLYLVRKYYMTTSA